MVGLEDGESEFERLFFDRGALRPQVASRRAVRLGDNAGDFKIVLIEFPESGKGEFGSAEKNYIHKIIRLCEVGGRGNPSFARLLRLRQLTDPRKDIIYFYFFQLYPR